MATSKSRRSAKPSRRAAPAKAKAQAKAQAKPQAKARAKAKSKPKSKAKPKAKDAKKKGKRLGRADHKAIKKAIKKAVKKAVKREVRKALKKVAKSVVPPQKVARLNRPRRVLSEEVPTPPSSLDLDAHPSAARSGRAQTAQRAASANMSSSITGGDPDVNVEDAYFTGDGAPGGDNPSPDQEVVEEIGKALGVEYQDAEELRGEDKLTERDKHRWELDPASSEDYKSRK